MTTSGYIDTYIWLNAEIINRQSCSLSLSLFPA